MEARPLEENIGSVRARRRVARPDSRLRDRSMAESVPARPWPRSPRVPRGLRASHPDQRAHRPRPVPGRTPGRLRGARLDLAPGPRVRERAAPDFRARRRFPPGLAPVRRPAGPRPRQRPRHAHRHRRRGDRCRPAHNRHPRARPRPRLLPRRRHPALHLGAGRDAGRVGARPRDRGVGAPHGRSRPRNEAAAACEWQLPHVGQAGRRPRGAAAPGRRRAPRSRLRQHRVDGQAGRVAVGRGLRPQLAHPGRLGPPHPRCRAARRLRAADRRRTAAHPLVEPGRALDLLLRGQRERGHASQADPRGRRAGRGGGHPGVAMGGWDGPRPHPDPCEHVAVPGPGPHQRTGPKRASRGPGPGGRPLRRVQRSRLLLQSGANRGHGSRGRRQRFGCAGARHPGGERDRDGGGRWRHRGGAGADPRLGRPCRRMGLGRPPLPPQLRRALRPRPIRPDPQDGGRGAGIRDTAPRQSAQPLRGPGSLGLGEVGRAALHPLRAGDPVALPRPHRAAGDPRAALAVGVGTGLRGLRDRRSHQRGGARPRAPHRRIRLLRPPRVDPGSLRGGGRRQGSRRTGGGRRHGRCGRPGGDVPVEQLRGHRGSMAPLPQPRRGDRAVRGNRRDAQPPPHDGGRRHARVRPHRGSPELAGLPGRAARGPFVRDQRPASGLPGRHEGGRRRRSGPGRGSRPGHRVRSGRS